MEKQTIITLGTIEAAEHQTVIAVAYVYAMQEPDARARAAQQRLEMALDSLTRGDRDSLQEWGGGYTIYPITAQPRPADVTDAVLRQIIGAVQKKHDDKLFYLDHEIAQASQAAIVRIRFSTSHTTVH